MSSQVRAGRAFIEMLINDESVQRSLDQVKMKLATFRATVDATGSSSFATMGSAGTVAMTTVGSSVGVLAASLGVLNAVTRATGTVFRTSFGFVTTSVTKAVISLALISGVIARLAGGNSRIGNLFSQFLSRAELTEKIGRWTRFIGSLTGSSALKGLGNQIERLGLGAAVVSGFQRGFIPGIRATIGAAFRSARSTVLGALGGLVTMPIRWFRGSREGLAQVASGSAAAVPQVNALTGALTKTTKAAQGLGGTRSTLAALGSTLTGLAIKAIAVSAAISGPALVAARSFATSAAEIMKQARETGKSIAQLVEAKYGRGSLISVEDIKAGAALSQAMDALKQSVATAWAQIGIAALPILTAMTQASRRAAEALSGIVTANRGLITSVVTVAARVGSATAAILAVWKAAVMLTPVLTALVSPLGLIAGGIVAVTIAFPALRTEAVDVFNYLFGNFGELLTIVQDTASGIMDALAGGSIEAAARMLWAGLYLAWLKGSEQLRAIYRQLTNNLASWGIDAFYGFQRAFETVLGALSDAWNNVVRGFKNAWKSAQDLIAGGLARVIAKLTGQNTADVLETLREMQQAESKASDSAYDQARKNREAETKQRLAAIEAERQAMQDSLAEEHQGREDAARAGLATAQEDYNNARDAARSVYTKRFATTAPAAKVAAELTGQIGTFSANVGGRIGIAGTSPLQKATEETARNTERIANNTENIRTETKYE